MKKIEEVETYRHQLRGYVTVSLPPGEEESPARSTPFRH